MPALPSCLIEPIWEQFAALLPERHDRHPLGCHRPRIGDRMVFELLINVLVLGSGYRRHSDRVTRPAHQPILLGKVVVGPSVGESLAGCTQRSPEVDELLEAGIVRRIQA